MRGSQKALNREVSEENVCVFENCNRCIKNESEENGVGGREAVTISPGRDDEGLTQVSGCADG